MVEERKGHAATVVKLHRVEVVVVAGGWGYLGQELASVAMYKPEKDQWSMMPSMPEARLDFSFHVRS